MGKIVTRIQIDMDESQSQAVDTLKKDCKFTNSKDLIDNALTLLDWAIEEIKQGRSIGSYQEKPKKFCKLIMPCLQRVKK